jgi:hypothetical protein
MPTDLDRVITAINQTRGRNRRPIHERLILEWKWRDRLDLTDQRQAMWDLLEAAGHIERRKLLRSYAKEINALSLARHTWVIDKLRREGLLPA